MLLIPVSLSLQVRYAWYKLLNMNLSQTSSNTVKTLKSSISNTDKAKANLDVQSPVQILSVEKLNIQIKQLLEGQVGVVWVQGELSNFKAHASGHFYFSLKDSKSQITAVMFRGFNSRLRFKPVDGMEVIIRGRISVYEPRGNYQILCETMEPVGAGALQKAFEQLKVKLKNEGLFESAKKKPIPKFPQHIAIVTSPTGAAIQDILNILNRRVSNIEITVVPTVVQGADAAPQILLAFQKALLLPKVEVVIIGRGGGSAEDLWAFNDETLARAIAASPLPVISAVGHEIDFTICDFVSDLRAPTPSAAAELVTQNSLDVQHKVTGLSRMLKMSVEKNVKNWIQKFTHLKMRLVDPQKKLNDFALRNDDLRERLDFALKKRLSDLNFRIQLLAQRVVSPIEAIEKKRVRAKTIFEILQRSTQIFLERKSTSLRKNMALLDSMSPLRVVDRGYSIVTIDGCVIKSYKGLHIDQEIQIRMAEGILKAKITNASPN